MTQNINGFPNPALLTEGTGNCILLAPLTSSSALGGAGAIGAAAQAHLVGAQPAIGNFSFDATLGMTQGASAQSIKYSMTNSGLQGSFTNYTASFNIDKTFYTSTTDSYLFSTGGGANALFYAVQGANGKHDYSESGTDSSGLNANIYTYQEDKPAQIQHVITGTSTAYNSYIDGLKILTGPRVFTSGAWTDFYVGSLTTSTAGITTNHMNNFVLQNRTVAFPPSKIKSVGFLGTSYYSLSSVPHQLFTANNFIDWIPRGKSGGTGYTATDSLTPVGTANGGGTGGTVTVATVSPGGEVLTATATGGTGYIAGSIITAVTGGTGTGARFVVQTVSSGALATISALNPYGYQGGSNALLTTGGYDMFASDATALTTYSRGDTSVICQIIRSLFKAGHYPVVNAHRSEAGCYVSQLIGTTAATSRSFLCGFEAMKTADNVHPDLVFINVGTNEAVEATSGGANYNAFDANYKTLLTNLAADGVQAVVLQEVLSVANNTSLYSNPAYAARVIALNAIINALPAWAISQGMTMKVIVDPVYAKFGGATPNSALFRTTDIHPNAIGTSLLGSSAGATAVAALTTSSSTPGSLAISPLFGPCFIV